MAMTQLQRDALSRAKAGDWTLADAMELVERAAQDEPPATIIADLLARNEDTDGEPVGVLFGVRENGRLRWLAWGLTECKQCDGSGQHTCDECGHAGECPEYEGTGGGTGDVLCVTDLNDNVVSGDDEPTMATHNIRDLERARKVLATYRNEQHEQRGSAARQLENA